MCNFFSCICKKDKSILWEPDIDAHVELLEKAGLLDNTDDSEKMIFARVEITPPNDDVFHTKITDWTLKIDERIIPEWFSHAHEQACFDALDDCLAIVIVDGQKIETLKEKKGLYIRDSIIQNIINCNICEMRGTSQVGEMWETSRIGQMRETSRIGQMWETSRIGEMWESSQVGEMRETSRIGQMRETSRIGQMRGTSQVGEMRESSQVGEMRESSQVGIYNEKVKFKIMPNTKALAIYYCADKTQIIHATGTVIETKEDTCQLKNSV